MWNWKGEATALTEVRVVRSELRRDSQIRTGDLILTKNPKPVSILSQSAADCFLNLLAAIVPRSLLVTACSMLARAFIVVSFVPIVVFL